ncbi:MAG: 16S rRNA (cytosine(967)-C(5))-methyltransferase RsmB [Clostridia bacterium]|nr:16S rRNA (cytosine(967)-C(5))-methyltransferase RsmB [Clostridia bacterium]
MKDFVAERSAYNVLKEIFLNKAYSSIVLDRALDNAPTHARAKITSLVYGVLEKSVRLDYIISQLAKKGVKNNIAVLLKLALYDLLYGNEPEYAVVKKYVDFAKDRFFGAHGFINATLRNAKSVMIDDKNNDKKSLSLRFSLPEWVIEKFISDFGVERTIEILSADVPKMTHIRPNTRMISKEDFDAKIRNNYKNSEYLPTKYGYYVSHSILSGLNNGEYTAQSLASCIAVNLYVVGLKGKLSVLDLCSAPGGKAIYLEELLPDSEIIACDVHPHRTQLIRSYASRMKSDVKPVVNDATCMHEEWIEKFDLVVCDVPCTGSGLVLTSPDIMLFKTASDVETLNEIQFNILLTSANYVKKDGILVYSTCSLFNDENERVVNKFLGERSDFEILQTLSENCNESGMTRLFPDKDGSDGFFVTRFIRK